MEKNKNMLCWNVPFVAEKLNVTGYSEGKEAADRMEGLPEKEIVLNI